MNTCTVPAARRLSLRHGRRAPVSRRVWHGVAIIEMALILPLFLLVLFGIVEYGFALYNKAIITNASREAARDAIIFRVTKRTQAEIETYATSLCSSRVVSFGSSNCSAVASFTSPAKSGDPLTVTVNYDYKGFYTYLSNGSITASTKMNFE